MTSFDNLGRFPRQSCTLITYKNALQCTSSLLALDCKSQYLHTHTLKKLYQKRMSFSCVKRVLLSIPV